MIAVNACIDIKIRTIKFIRDTIRLVILSLCNYTRLKQRYNLGDFFSISANSSAPIPTVLTIFLTFHSFSPKSRIASFIPLRKYIDINY